MWPENYRTPRYVWSASAIAASVLHAGAIWWGVTAWQNSQSASSPVPIQLIALPADAAIKEGAVAPAATPMTPPTTADTDSLQALLPVAPSDSGPPPTAPASPVTAAPSAAPTTSDPVPPSQPDAIAPIAPAAPGQPEVPTPSRPVPPSQPPSSRPPVAQPPVSPEPPAAPGGGSSSNSQPGIQSFWTPRLAGADIPDEPPSIPAGWRESAAAVLSNSSCAAQLAPGTTARVTLWPDIEEDGTISGFTTWEGDENAGDEALVRCLERIGTRFPPLVPARSGGRAIASYAILLDIEIRVSQ